MNIKYVVITSIFLFAFSKTAICQNDTLNLYYDIGVFKLNKSNYETIQSKLKKLNDSTSYQVEIISSCDFLGSNKANLNLSYKRATTVKDLLLIKKNVAISSITHKGIGELPSILKKVKGNAAHRKTILIFKDETQIILDHIVNAKKGDVFVLRDIIFEPGRHFLKKESLVTLQRLLKIMLDNKELEIELSGHVCCGKNRTDLIDGYDKDSKTYNLSENRAKHIFKFLLLKNIDKNRLSFKGYGFRKPLYYPEENIFHKKMNRRVEIKVIKN